MPSTKIIHKPMDVIDEAIRIFTYMKRSDIPVMPKYFDRYIALADDIDLVDGLIQTMDMFDAESKKLEAVADRRYAPGKWTILDILQHIIDTERVMAYRALRIIRNDKTPLPGFDEGLFAANTTANDLKVEDLIKEFRLVRASSIYLFMNSTDEMILRSGTCSNQEISALALGFVLVGHQIHHMNVIRERYYPLV